MQSNDLIRVREAIASLKQVEASLVSGNSRPTEMVSANDLLPQGGHKTHWNIHRPDPVFSVSITWVASETTSTDSTNLLGDAKYESYTQQEGESYHAMLQVLFERVKEIETAGGHVIKLDSGYVHGAPTLTSEKDDVPE